MSSTPPRPAATSPHPTVHQVATEAGVSVGTVSNVLNHPERVSADTAVRVRAVIDRLGFIRNANASSLASQRARGVGLLVPDIENSLFVGISRGAQRTARALELNLLLASTGFSIPRFEVDPLHPDVMDDYLDYFAEARASGILLGTMRDPRQAVERIRGHVPPIIVINWDDPAGEWCTVLMDNEAVGRQSIEHLAGTGIRRVYFMSPADIVQPIVERRRGVYEAAGRLGVEIVEVPVRDLWVKDGLEAGTPLIDDWRRGDARWALLGVTDTLALGVLELLRRRPDIRVPEDVAVMGMDSNHQAVWSDWIPLTSFQFPAEDMGATAMTLLQDELQNPAGHVHQRVVLPTHVLPRRSTVGAPPSPGERRNPFRRR